MSFEEDGYNFDNVAWLAVDYPLEQTPDAEADETTQPTESLYIDLSQTEAYEYHQVQVKEWMESINQFQYNSTPHFLTRCYADYVRPSREDLAKKAKLFEPLVQVADKDGGRNHTSNLYGQHMDLALFSPHLSLYQKFDLVMLTAQSLADTDIPADGRKFVLSHISNATTRITRAAKKQGQPENPNVLGLVEEFDTLADMIGHTLPKLSRRQWLKMAASKIAGKEITNSFVALDIVMAKADAGDPVLEARNADRTMQREQERQEANELKAQEYLLKAARKAVRKYNLTDSDT